MITGFGYALDDIFENNEINMQTLIKKEVEIESSSPFRSPKPGSTLKKKKKKKKMKKEEEEVGPPT